MSVKNLTLVQPMNEDQSQSASGGISTADVNNCSSSLASCIDTIEHVSDVLLRASGMKDIDVQRVGSVAALVAERLYNVRELVERELEWRCRQAANNA